MYSIKNEINYPFVPFAAKTLPSEEVPPVSFPVMM